MRAREFSTAKKDLIIFDIDDTLLHTNARISVVKDGEVIRKLSNQEFNHYELKPGEQFDFGEFRSAEKFNQESKPIQPMIRKLKTILAHGANSEVIMLTARSDFDNRDLFLKTFTDLGIDMSRVHVHRAGNLPGDEIPAEKKAVYVRKYADTGLYDHIRLYDDSMSNLRVFKDLKTEYPDIDFRAYYVGPKGTTEPISEGASIAHHKDNFIEMFKKFLPIAMKYIGLKHLPKMKFEAHVHDDVQPTFGKYENGEHILYVSLMNRHPNDILRTIAHELTHYKQDTEHQLDADSGRTGSPIENQAHAVAGIVMRHFNKQYPEYLSSKPITESLDEVFDTNAGKKAVWDTSDPESVEMTFTASNGVQYNLNFSHPYQEPDHGSPDDFFDEGIPDDIFDRCRYVMFNQTGRSVRDYKMGIEGTGAAAEVFGIVVNAMLQYIKKSKPVMLYFWASEPNRAKLYTRMIQRLAGSLPGWTSKVVNGNQFAIYKIQAFAGIEENFADGKHPGRKGLSKRMGVNTKASVSSLRRTAKHSTGEKARMAHWLANMKAGRAKKKK